MRIQKERVTCKECGEISDLEIVVDAPLSVAIASMKALSCPKCSGNQLGMGGAYKDSPSLDTPIMERVAWWRERGDIGTSSLTIFVAFCGGSSPHGRFDVPHDPDDFYRCKALLDLVPEWRKDLSVVSKKFPFWKPFVDRWDEFDELFDEENPSGTCPKLYALMKSARIEAEKIQ